MANLFDISIKYGLKENLDGAGVVAGDLKFTTDTNQLFIGNGTKNVNISSSLIKIEEFPTEDIRDDKLYLLLNDIDDKTLKGLYYYADKWVPVIPAGSFNPAFDTFIRREEFLYDVTYSKYDKEYADAYMEETYKHTPAKSLSHKPFQSGKCTIASVGNMLGKNFDWTYNNEVVFIVHQKSTMSNYASIGFAAGKPLFNEGDMPIQSSEKWKLVPFFVNAGINENGVSAGLNVVPVGEPGFVPTTGTNKGKPDMCALAMVKYILDHATSAKSICNDLQNNWNIYCPYGEDLSEELHLMVKDSEETYVIEFIGNKTKVIDLTNTSHKYITNFYIYNATFGNNGKVAYNTVTPHGMGVQRSYDLVDGLVNVENVRDLAKVMCENVMYTNAYNPDKHWLDEFVGKYPVYGDFTVQQAFESPHDYDVIMEKAQELYNTRDRNTGLTWHSVVSTVFADKKMYIIVQEKGLASAKCYNINSDNDKVDTFQGFDNANKVLGTDELGNVVLKDGSATGGQTSNTIVTDPETESISKEATTQAEINVEVVETLKKKQDSDATTKEEFIKKYGNITLLDSPIDNWQQFIDDNYDNTGHVYCPYNNNAMVEVWIDKDSEYPLIWNWAGLYYGKNASGIKSIIPDPKILNKEDLSDAVLKILYNDLVDGGDF